MEVLTYWRCKMRIYIKRENVSRGVWMDLPASQDEIERIYMELKDMHPSGMIPFVAGVESDIPPLAGCLEDCTVFADGHMSLFNELARDMVVWEKDEKARFGAALIWNHPDTIETVMDVAKHLDQYILDDRMKNWEEAGRLELEKRGIQIDKRIEPFLDLESIGKEYVVRDGCMTPMGYVIKKQTGPCRSKEQGYEPNKGCLLSVHMIDEYWNKQIFQLPLTEQKKASQSVRKWDAYAIQHTSGYLGELLCYLPPGITLSELDRVTDVISREVIRRGVLEKEKLYAILEAGLPKTIGEACDIIQGYENHVYVPSDKMGHKEMARMLALQYARIVLPEELKPFCRYEEYMESFPDRYVVTTSTGHVFHPTRDYSCRLSEGRTIRLYSPLTVTLFWNDRDGFMPEILSGERLIKQKTVIETVFKRHLPSDEECMGAFLDNRLLRAKIEHMIPGTEVYDGQLWCALEVKTIGTLTEAEQEELKMDWLRQMREGWGLSLLEYPIYTEGGEMHIGLWDEDYGTELCIKTEEELRGPDLPTQESGRMGPYM